jgi:hypothetical protein
MEAHHQRRPLPASIHPWRPFSPDSRRAHDNWVLNARNALDSGRTGERGGGQHPATSGHPIGQRLASGTTGLKVQLPPADGRSKVPILQSGHSRAGGACRCRMRAVRPQFDRRTGWTRLRARSQAEAFSRASTSKSESAYLPRQRRRARPALCGGRLALSDMARFSCGHKRVVATGGFVSAPPGHLKPAGALRHSPPWPGLLQEEAAKRFPGSERQADWARITHDYRGCRAANEFRAQVGRRS